LSNIKNFLLSFYPELEDNLNRNIFLKGLPLSRFKCNYCKEELDISKLNDREQNAFLVMLEIYKTALDNFPDLFCVELYRCSACQKKLEYKQNVSPHNFGLAMDISLKDNNNKILKDFVRSNCKLARIGGEKYDYKYIHVDFGFVINSFTIARMGGKRIWRSGEEW